MMSHENFGFDGMGYYMSGGGIMFFVFLLIIIGLVFFFIKNGQNSGNATTYQSDSALELLKRRFANSEISEEEYLSKKEMLS